MPPRSTNGDLVFYQVQRSNQYHAHIVVKVEDSVDRSQETETRYTSTYWVGNIEQHVNQGRYDNNFPPFQAVSSKGGGISKFQNDASELHEGDIVFCQVQRSNQNIMSCARGDVQIGYKQCRAMLCALIESANG